MDSLTHLVLGSAIGEVALGKKIGHKAALIGAIANTLPDLDIFFNFFTDDPILKLQIHRSYSHAFLIHILIAFPLAWLTHRIFKRRILYRQWYLLWVLGLVSHALLDCCTTYGTQLLLPFSHQLVGFNNIAVIDVFFTLPFMVFVVTCLFMNRKNPLRIKCASAGIGYALLYICFSLVNKHTVRQHFNEELSR